MKQNLSSQRSHVQTGFTVIELLVAVSVTALMVSLMLTIVVNVMGGWNRSSGNLTSGNQARTVLDILSRDLQSAIFKRNGDVWLAVTNQESGLVGDWANSKKPSSSSVESPELPTVPGPLPSLEDFYRFGQAGAWLRFIATIPGSNTGTDISAPRVISYQIIRRSVSDGSKEQSYMLHRAEVSPQDTFNNGYDLYNPNDVYYSGEIRSPSLDAVIANNVVDFGVRCLKRNSTTGQLDLLFPYDDAKSFAASSDLTKTGRMAGENAPVIAFPDVIEVFVRVLTDEGVLQIANLEDPALTSITGDWWEIVKANSRVYTRRIEIKSTSL
jgi:type II secretory pathway pseudopilin PulG